MTKKYKNPNYYKLLTGSVYGIEGLKLILSFCVFTEPKNDLFLFYGKGRPGIIRGLDMNLKSSTEHMVPIEDLVNPRALDYHAEMGNIYFADTTSFLIGRQKVDGSSRETILKDGDCWTFCNLLHIIGVFSL